MGREEFCITCRAADPECELHYLDTVITVYEPCLLATYNFKDGSADVFIPKKHEWAGNVDAKTLFKALEHWSRL